MIPRRERDPSVASVAQTDVRKSAREVSPDSGDGNYLAAQPVSSSSTSRVLRVNFDKSAKAVFAQWLGEVIGEPVVDGATGAAVRDQAGGAQDAQRVAGGIFGRAQGEGDVPHAQFLDGVRGVEDPGADRVGEQAEQRRAGRPRG